MSRRHWVVAHRWVALALGAHWLLLAFTGMLLVFHREIETAWIGAGPAIERPVDLEQAVLAAERPGASVIRVTVQDFPIRALRVFLENARGQEVVTLDASSGRILSATALDGSGSPSGMVRYVYRLHQQLLLGHNGEWLVGASGLFLLLTVVAGARLGWPRRGNWKRTLWPRVAGKPWQKFYAVHRAIGLVVGVLLILSALSGAGMIWSKELRALFAASGQAELLSARPEQRGLLGISPNEALARAAGEFPEAQFARIDLPGPDSTIYVVQLRQPDEWRTVFGTSAVAVDGRDGRVLWRKDPLQDRWGDRLLDALFSLHNGEWLGLPGRLLMALTGLLLSILIGLGVAIWALRPRRA